MATRFEHAKMLDGVSGVLRFAQNPLGRLEEARRLYGTRAFYRQLGTSVALLMDPESIEEALVGNASSLNKDRFTAQLGRVLGRGLVTSEGDLWKRQRKLMAPSFQPRHIEKLASVVVTRTEEGLLRGYQTGQTRNVNDDMMRLTLDIVVSTLFGSTPIASDEVDEHLADIMTDFHTLMFTWRALFPNFPFPSRRRLTGSRDRLHRIVLDIIHAKRATAGTGEDLLSRLIAAQDEAGRGMSEAQLLDEALTVFLAGHETTALALTYALCCLAQHPEALVRLEKEVDEVLGGESASLESLPLLPFTSAVIKETMRLYPPVWAIGRASREPIHIGGTLLLEGTEFLIPQWVVQRDATLFAEPLRFAPERWLSRECEALPRFAYFPFGGGSRVCIGNHFAMLEATLVLATIVRRVRLTLPADFTLRFLPTITLRPAVAIEMRVRERVSGSRVRSVLRANDGSSRTDSNGVLEPN